MHTSKILGEETLSIVYLCGGCGQKVHSMCGPPGKVQCAECWQREAVALDARLDKAQSAIRFLRRQVHRYRSGLEAVAHGGPGLGGIFRGIMTARKALRDAP